MKQKFVVLGVAVALCGLLAGAASARQPKRLLSARIVNHKDRQAQHPPYLADLYYGARRQRSQAPRYRYQAPRYRYQPPRNYDRTTHIAVSGWVSDISYGRQVQVTLVDGRWSARAVLGSRRSLAAQGISIHRGDWVTVRGNQVTRGGDRYIVADSVSVEGRSHQRDRGYGRDWGRRGR